MLKNKTQMPTMSATTELANAMGQEKSVRGIRMIKEKKKTTIFADMTIYLENSRKSY